MLTLITSRYHKWVHVHFTENVIVQDYAGVCINLWYPHEHGTNMHVVSFKPGPYTAWSHYTVCDIMLRTIVILQMWATNCCQLAPHSPKPLPKKSHKHASGWKSCGMYWCFPGCIVCTLHRPQAAIRLRLYVLLIHYLFLGKFPYMELEWSTAVHMHPDC